MLKPHFDPAQCIAFTGSNITKYAGLNTVAKYMNRQNIIRSISSSFPTEWHNATKFGINQVLMAITLASISGISRICRIAAFSGDGLVKALLSLKKGINENAAKSSELGASWIIMDELAKKYAGGKINYIIKK